jgi:hypothetical protein
MRRTDRSLTFAPLRVRSFRFQWPADLLTSWALEMETLILGWYVMVGTGSVLLLTTFGSLQLLGTLAAPMFGVLSDRLGGRAMLCGMRADYALLVASCAVGSWGGRRPSLGGNVRGTGATEWGDRFGRAFRLSCLSPRGSAGSCWSSRRAPSIPATYSVSHGHGWRVDLSMTPRRVSARPIGL